MAQNCIFCEEELSLFNRKTLYACGTEQPVCKNCYARFIPLPRVEIGRRALATGRAQDAETLRAYLNDHDRRMQKKAAADESAQKARISDKLCSRCSVPMVIVGQQQFLNLHPGNHVDVIHRLVPDMQMGRLADGPGQKDFLFLTGT